MIDRYIVIWPVEGKRGRAEFVDLGRRFAAQTPCSVPQLRSEQLELLAFRCYLAAEEFDLDGAIDEMIKVKKPVIFDCRVANLENCFPMIPSGKAHNEMLLPAEANDEATAKAFAGGKALV